MAVQARRASRESGGRRPTAGRLLQVTSSDRPPVLYWIAAEKLPQAFDIY